MKNEYNEKDECNEKNEYDEYDDVYDIRQKHAFYAAGDAGLRRCPPVFEKQIFLIEPPPSLQY